MRLKTDSYGISPGTFVMNYHHGLLRFGVVDSKRIDGQGWAHCKVNWLEDDIHLTNMDWNKEMGSSRQELTEMRADLLQPVSPRWLGNVLNAYGEYHNDRTV
jgi:hypothetical protein